MEWLLNRRRFMARHAEEEWVDQGYLTFVAEEAGTFTFNKYGDRTVENIGSISYSLDNGKTWVTMTNNGTSNQTLTTPLIKPGKKVIWKGSIRNINTSREDAVNISRFSSTGNFSIYGNIMSLVTDDIGTSTTYPSGTSNTFSRLFFGCTKLKSINGLIFPQDSVFGCYYAMFMKCSGLTDAGVTIYLSTTDFSTSNSNTCVSMFRECTSLTIPPILPATQLTRGCYTGLFRGCTSLQIGPVLPALTVTYYGYYNMFNGCSSLNELRMYATNISAVQAVGNMLTGVAETGTFYKNAAATWDNSKCVPSGWTVETVTV